MDSSPLFITRNMDKVCLHVTNKQRELIQKLIPDTVLYLCDGGEDHDPNFKPEDNLLDWRSWPHLKISDNGEITGVSVALFIEDGIKDTPPYSEWQIVSFDDFLNTLTSFKKCPTATPALK